MTSEAETTTVLARSRVRERVTIGLLGAEPVDVAVLDAAVHEIAGDDVTVDVWLTRRERLTANG